MYISPKRDLEVVQDEEKYAADLALLAMSVKHERDDRLSYLVRVKEMCSLVVKDGNWSEKPAKGYQR